MKRYEDFDLSELEREFESDMSDELEIDTSGEFESDEELESEGDFESEGDYELDDESELDEELDSESEMEYEQLDGQASEYGERFFELGEREYESPGSMDTALHEVLDEMGREYFLGRAWRNLKKRAPGLSKLVNQGLKLASSAGLKIPALGALKNMSGLAQSILQGNLAGIGKNALGALMKAHPGLAAAQPFLSGLGFESTEDPAARRRGWHNFAEVARESYETLADTLNETAHRPAQAARLANNALQKALQASRQRPVVHAAGAVAGVRRGGKGKVRVVRLRPGQRLIVLPPKRHL
jgi:hypothetical protein